MRIAVFDTHSYDRHALEEANRVHGFTLSFLESRLTDETVSLANGYDAVCVFVNDRLDEGVLAALLSSGVRIIALRCAGFNNVDVAAAERLGISVARVPAYSPHAVAEHTVALLLCLNRKIHRAFARVREGNFSLDGLVGFDLFGKTVGIIGTGKIGSIVARIMLGFGCKVLAFDLYPDDQLTQEAGVRYVPFEDLLAQSHILTLHLPLSDSTVHLIDARVIAAMQPGAILLNTSRGGLVDTEALIEGLKRGHIGGAGLDVFEREAGVFFEDLSNGIIQDDQLARLLTFPNVLITGHQAFLTDTALRNIAETTLENLSAIGAGKECPNLVTRTHPLPPRT